MDTRRAIAALRRRIKDQAPRDTYYDGVACRFQDVMHRNSVELKCLELLSKHDWKIWEAARAHEEVELVERMEKAVGELRRRRGRLAQEPGVQ